MYLTTLHLATMEEIEKNCLRYLREKDVDGFIDLLKAQDSSFDETRLTELLNNFYDNVDLVKNQKKKRFSLFPQKKEKMDFSIFVGRFIATSLTFFEPYFVIGDGSITYSLSGEDELLDKEYELAYDFSVLGNEELFEYINVLQDTLSGGMFIPPDKVQQCKEYLQDEKYIELFKSDFGDEMYDYVIEILDIAISQNKGIYEGCRIIDIKPPKYEEITYLGSGANLDDKGVETIRYLYYQRLIDEGYSLEELEEMTPIDVDVTI